MKVTQITKTGKGQDGAIFNGNLFRFDNAKCFVYDLDKINNSSGEKLEPYTEFTLNKAEIIVPHSNSVSFGTTYFDKNDEYPLVYTNIYNNKSKFDDNLMGVCCVYRLQKIDNAFKTTLVQIIQIGFTENSEIWKASEDSHGVRPYGNFCVDVKSGYYYAFVMRDENLGCNCFKFNIPKISDGELDPIYKVNKVTLNVEDILDCFTYPFQNYLQGASINNGKLYSTEGFTSEIYKPAIKVINLETKQQEQVVDLLGLGCKIEPEFIDFDGDVCYYGDGDGNLFNVEF